MTFKTYILTALLAAGTLAPVGASAADLPVVAAGGGPGHGWVAIKFSTDGANATLNVTGWDIDQPGHAGAYSFDQGGNYLGGAQVLVVQGLGHAIVQGNPVDGVSIDHRLETVKAPGYGASVTYRFNDPADGPNRVAGTFRLVLMASRSASWSWELRGNPGVQLLGTDAGTETDAFMSERFTGVANASAYVYGAGARASALTTTEVTASSNLVGTFWSLAGVGAHVAQTSMVTPNGAERPCTCTFGPFAGAGGGPGTYTFKMSGVGAGLTNANEVFVGYADARLVL